MRGFVSGAAVVAIGGLALILCTGCAGTGYLADRARDAGDVFTATGGVGMGASVKCAFLNLGAISFADKAGLRAGEFYTDPEDGTTFAGQSDLLLMGETVFRTPETRRRGTDIHDIKFLGVSEVPTGGRSMGQMTQFEIAGALGVGLRLGVNPGELVDFFLGWAYVDVFGDDMGEAPSGEAER